MQQTYQLAATAFGRVYVPMMEAQACIAHAKRIATERHMILELWTIESKLHLTVLSNGRIL